MKRGFVDVRFAVELQDRGFGQSSQLIRDCTLPSWGHFHIFAYQLRVKIGLRLARLLSSAIFFASVLLLLSFNPASNAK